MHGIRVENGAIAEGKINGGGGSTKAEIVGSDNALQQCLWLRYFIERQGYAVVEIKFRQDKMSAMLTENNCKESSMKRTKHI